MREASSIRRRLRWGALALIVVLGTFWAGARWGPPRLRGERVEALPLQKQPAPNTAGLTDEETINVRVYRQASPAVANIVTRAASF